MHHLRQPAIGPKHLPRFLQDLVDRFGAETGITAAFRCQTAEIRLSPRSCLEVVNVAREALANVRKHSGALNVWVDLGPDRFTVTDDGRGFEGGGGEKPQGSLWAITEPARQRGATLTVGSTPGAGTRIEFVFAKETPWTARLA
jgi:nitrate/nitrite-specific signal transduction histidine kinase